MRNHILHIGYHPRQSQFLSDVNQYICKFGNEDDQIDICSLMLSAAEGYHVMFPDREKNKWLRDSIIVGLEYLTGVPLGFIMPDERVDLSDVIKSDYNENIISASNNELDNNLHIVLHVPVMSSDCCQFIEHVYQSIPDNLNEHVKVHCIAYASNFFSNEPCDESRCRGRLNELKAMMEASQVSRDGRFFYISNYDERGRCLQLNEDSELARFVARLLIFISNDYNALSVTRANTKYITSVGVYGREIDKYSEINNHFANLMKNLLARFIGLNEEPVEISLDKVDDFINDDYELLHQYYESDSNDYREETNKKLQESLKKILNSKDLTLNEKSELLNNLKQLWDKDLNSIENTPHKTFEDIYIPLIEASGLETPYPAVKELVSLIKQQKKSIEAHEKKIEKLSKQLPEFQQNCYWTEDGFRVGDTVQRVEDKPLDSNDSITDITDYVPTNSELLKSVDISSSFPKIKSQGRQGACVSFSLVSIIEYYLKNAGKPVDLSEAFLYYVSREKNGTEDKDNGVTVRL